MQGFVPLLPTGSEERGVLGVGRGMSIWADLWGGVSVHGIIYDIYYVILIMNTDYAQIVP